MKNRSSDTTSVGIGTSGGAETTACDDDRVTIPTQDHSTAQPKDLYRPCPG